MQDHSTNPQPSPLSEPKVHRRRPRYSGRYPRRFSEKYKEHAPDRFPETYQKVLRSGKTPAGSHRPIMVEEVISVLSPRPGEVAVDCTLGYGGHAQAVMARLLPGGRLIGLDQDPIELARTESRLRAAGFGQEVLTVRRVNFAGLWKTLSELSISGVDLVLADLGVSSMQLDDPLRGFSVKHEGPLDMRMNPDKGSPASAFLQKTTPDQLRELLIENADEPFANLLGAGLARQKLMTTRDLAYRIRELLADRPGQDVELSIRRTFQALRIAVNDEFSALDGLLRQLPSCLRPGGRAAFLAFHSGEDRRVKKAFSEGLRLGTYSEISEEVIRPSLGERNDNPRSASAKLRWARVPRAST